MATGTLSDGRWRACDDLSGPFAEAPAKKAAKAVTEAPKSVEPPLHEVVLGLLRTQPGHPHLAREVHTELAEKYGRSTSIQVVRNSLESLVKKGSIEKENKQNSVMYTGGRLVLDSSFSGYMS
jgi:hypothetical protein